MKERGEGGRNKGMLRRKHCRKKTEEDRREEDICLPGSGNSIFLSILPGLMRAGSRLSILLVAMITFTSPLSSNPSS